MHSICISDASSTKRVLPYVYVQQLYTTQSFNQKYKLQQYTHLKTKEKRDI